ncbi:MAG: carboxy terminal-processing peptidase [Flavobacteriaceae bacterium]|nr:carboxy terminal-processing peptidase [Flavobacteriaceae bacterium]
MRLFGLFVVGIFALILIGSSNSGLDNPDKDKLLIEVITYVMQKGHYDPKDIDDTFSERVFENYIQGIDGQRRFFLQSDINNFKRYKDEIDDQIREADVSFFNLTYDRLIARMDQVKQFYEELLIEPFDFRLKDSINLNFEEVPYARTLNGLKDLWRKRFKLSTLEYFSDLVEQEDFEKEKDSTYQIRSKIVLEEEARSKTRENIENYFEIFDEVERKDWFSIYVNSITLEFDPHSNYFALDDKEKFDQNISGKFEGIGARLQKKDQVVEIIEVIVGGPVWKAKALEVGDIILKVAQKDEDAVEIGPMRLSDAVKLIKGPKGTQVFLTVRRVSGVIEEVVINRDVVELEESYAKSTIIQKNGKNYGLIQLPKFYIDFKDQKSRNAASDVKKELEALKKRNVSGIIVDLRNNGGGSLKTVVDITGFFIDKGPVVQVKSTGGAKDILYDEDPSIVWDGSLVVMVNQFSASASEILAAALQDYKRAIILGSKQTFGKGTVQNVIDLNRIISGGTHGDLGAVKLTTDKFYRINGGSTQLEGVRSDIIFKNQYSYIDMGEKDQENPLSWDRIEPAPFKQWENQTNLDYALNQSAIRLKENPYIQLVEQQARRIEDQQDDYVYTLNYKDYLTEQETNKKISDKFSVLKDYKSDLTFKWLQDSKVSVDEVVKERKERWIEGLEKDFYISEAVSVLEDLNINLENYPVAQIKK